MIKAVVSDEKVAIEICSIHLGHECDISRLRLSIEDKNIIAGKLSAGVPSRRILRDIREEAPEKLNRIHYAEMSDINNIKRAYGITCPLRSNESDRSSVDVSQKHEVAHNADAMLQEFEVEIAIINDVYATLQEEFKNMPDESQSLRENEAEASRADDIMISSGLDLEERANRRKVLTEEILALDGAVNHPSAPLTSENTSEVLKLIRRACAVMRFSSSFKLRRSLGSNEKILKKRKYFSTKKRRQKKKFVPSVNVDCKIVIND